MAIVDGSGLATAAGNGKATITASAGAASETAVVTVMQAPDSVVVLPAEATVAAVGETLRLTAEAFDANGRAIAGAQFSWKSSDAVVATVDASGLVAARGGGTATITASAGSVSGSAEITVAVTAASPDWRTLKTPYETAGGANWTKISNRVEVDAAVRVTGLALAGNNLTGWIPPEIGDLDRLQCLHVGRQCVRKGHKGLL